MRIIIAEDEELVANILQASFSRYSYQFYFDAVSASEALAKHHFDLLITDITMPGIGGGERLIVEANNRDIPSVVYTSASEINESFYLSIGASAVFYKNQSIKLLIGYVNDLVSKLEKHKSAS